MTEEKLSQEQSNSFNIVLKGDIQNLDVDSLISTLDNFSSIVEQIRNKTRITDSISLKVKPFQSGSFPIQFVLDPQTQEIAKQLFTHNKLDLLIGGKLIIEAIIVILKLKKHLKGEKPTEIKTNSDVNTIEVKNNKGEVEIVNKTASDFYFHNSIININVNNTFKDLEKVEGIEGFEIEQIKGIPLLQIPKEEFSSMKKLNKAILELKEKDRIRIEENVALSIFKVVFGKNYKWDFYYKGFKVHVNMKDDNFLTKVQTGEHSFRNGDTLFVDLEITETFDDEANTFVNTGFSIIKVNNIKHQSVQDGLFDKKDNL